MKIGKNIDIFDKKELTSKKAWLEVLVLFTPYLFLFSVIFILLIFKFWRVIF